MIVLGVETSGRVGSIALRRGGRCVEERFLPELGRRHAQSLVPEVVAFLRRHDLSPAAVEGVAVSVGPGSFTGLRIGVTFAKCLAYAAGAKLAAVETFAAIAENTPGERDVAVVADAQRGGWIVGRYRRNDVICRFVRVGELGVSLVPWDGLAPNTLLTGGVSDRLLAALPIAVALGPPSLREARASVVARLGEEALRAGRIEDPARLEPVYVRKSGAEEKREAARGADG